MHSLKMYGLELGEVGGVNAAGARWRSLLRPLLSHRKHLLTSFKKSTPPHNRQLFVNIREVDDFVGELTFEIDS